MSRLLSDDERSRFAIWLQQDAESNELLANQMEKAPFGIPGELVKRKRLLAAAERLVAAEITLVETQTL